MQVLHGAHCLCTLSGFSARAAVPRPGSCSASVPLALMVSAAGNTGLVGIADLHNPPIQAVWASRFKSASVLMASLRALMLARSPSQPCGGLSLRPSWLAGRLYSHHAQQMDSLACFELSRQWGTALYGMSSKRCALNSRKPLPH